MARDMDNPDRAGKDMDMDDTRAPCPDCGTKDPDDHGKNCRYASE